MEPLGTQRDGVGAGLRLAALVAAALTLASGTALAGLRHIDPAEVLPMAQIAPEQRESVAEVIRDHTFHRQSEPDTFPCSPQVYLTLLDEPALTLALWKDLSDSTIVLRPVGPGRYQGTNGAGASAVGQYIIRTPQLHVLLASFDAFSPKGNLRLEGRVLLIVRTGFFRGVRNESWIRHEVEAFVKIDSRGWKGLARTMRPIVERYLEDQVQEAGWFVSLMGRLVELYPDWAGEVVATKAPLDPQHRQAVLRLVQDARRPDAIPGRPALAENAGGSPPLR